MYYDPKNPADCVIPELDKIGNTGLIISCVASGIGVGFAALVYFVVGAILLTIRKKKMAAAQQ